MKHRSWGQEQGTSPSLDGLHGRQWYKVVLGGSNSAGRMLAVVCHLFLGTTTWNKFGPASAVLPQATVATLVMWYLAR